MGLIVELFLGSFDCEAKNTNCIENMIHTLVLKMYIFDTHYLEIALEFLLYQILLDISHISTTQRVMSC